MVRANAVLPLPVVPAMSTCTTSGEGRPQQQGAAILTHPQHRSKGGRLRQGVEQAQQAHGRRVAPGDFHMHERAFPGHTHPGAAQRQRQLFGQPGNLVDLDVGKRAHAKLDIAGRYDAALHIARRPVAHEHRFDAVCLSFKCIPLHSQTSPTEQQGVAPVTLCLPGVVPSYSVLRVAWRQPRRTRRRKTVGTREPENPAYHIEQMFGCQEGNCVAALWRGCFCATRSG